MGIKNGPIKAVLFDIDGTILKCHGAGKQALVQAAKDIFGTAGRMDSIDFQGKTDPLIIRESFEGTGCEEQLNGTVMEDLKERYFSYLREYIYSYEAEMLPGIVEILERLIVKDSVLVGILTGNFTEGANIKLARFGLNGYFAFGIFGDDAVLRNDMPPLAREKIRNRFGHDVPFHRMLIIGDTIHDIGCASVNGALSMSVGTGWSSRDLLLSRNPDYYFDDLGDVDRILEIIYSF